MVGYRNGFFLSFLEIYFDRYFWYNFHPNFLHKSLTIRLLCNGNNVLTDYISSNGNSDPKIKKRAGCIVKRLGFQNLSKFTSGYLEVKTSEYIEVKMCRSHMQNGGTNNDMVYKKEHPIYKLKNE